jgi:hypothetical protein
VFQVSGTETLESDMERVMAVLTEHPLQVSCLIGQVWPKEVKCLVQVLPPFSAHKAISTVCGQVGRSQDFSSPALAFPQETPQDFHISPEPTLTPSYQPTPPPL